jgi:phospholipid/cholesterol/gamma-HCH transport system substrate-binding protein
MENRSHALAAGIFVMLLALALAASVLYFSGRGESTTNYLLWTSGNVTGLNEKAEVRFRGIPVGKVENIRLDPADRSITLVEVRVRESFKLTKGTVARLNVQFISGLAEILLEDDGTNAVVLTADNGELPRIRIQPSLMETLAARGEDFYGKVAILADRLSGLLDDRNMKNLNRTMDNLAAGSDGLRQTPQLVAALREVLSPGNISRFSQALAHLEHASGETTPLAKEMRQMVRNMSVLAEKVDHVVADTGSQFTASTLPQIDALVRDLNANSRQVSRLLETLDQSPQALLFGKGDERPGPGESGFVRPPVVEK